MRENTSHNNSEYRHILGSVMVGLVRQQMKKQKRTIDRKTKIQDYKDFLGNKTVLSKSQQRFRSALTNVFTEKANEIALYIYG